MAITQTLPDGRKVILGPRGWEEMSPEQIAASEMSRSEAWGQGLGRNIAGYAALASQVVDPLANMLASYTFGATPPPGLEPLGRWSGERLAELEPAAQMHPGASVAGEIWLDPFNLAAGAGSVVRTGARGLRAASRVSRGVEAAGRQMLERIPSPAARRVATERTASGFDEYGLPQHQAAGESAAAEPKSLLEKLTAEFTTPVALTDQQRAAKAAVEKGLAEFSPLPGQFAGSRLMHSGVKSNPIWLAEFEPEMTQNYRAITNSLKRGMGLDEAVPFTDEVTGLAEETLGARYDAVRDMVQGEITLPGHVAEIAEQAMTPMEKSLIDLGKPLPADQLFQIRSDLSDLTRQLARDGNRTGIRATVQAIDTIDELLLPHIGEEGRQLFADTNARWRLKLVVDSGAVVSPSGQINLASANRAAKAIFRKQYRGWGPRKGLPDDVSRAIDQIKVGAAFPDAVGNSGTAERLSSIQALRDPRAYAKDRVVGKAIRALADRTQPIQPKE